MASRVYTRPFYQGCKAAVLSALLIAPLTPQAMAQTTPSEPTASAAENTEPAPVDPEARAVAFVEGLIADASTALTDENADEAARLKNFQAVLSDALALSFLSKFMVGRQAYEAMTAEQRARYETVFPDYITQQYAEQFDGILGQPLEVSETIARRSDIFVRTQFIRSEGGPINVDWRTRALDDGELKVRDIIVNGASIMSVKRSEFAAVIERDGIDRLIDLLAAELTSETTAATSEADETTEDREG
ncbi:MAG: ABC transporter substrate-binding protein [Pseudomonadota bacterium]